MAGVKGKSGRHTNGWEMKFGELGDLCIDILLQAIKSPDVSFDRKIEIAQFVVGKRAPSKPLIDQSHHTLILQVEKVNDKEITTARKAVASI